MNKPQHTPGPWYVDEGANGDVLVVGEHPELSEDVCQVYGGNDGDKAQALADASAIAALPDLLAIVDLLSRYTELDHPHFYSLILKAREAIANATEPQEDEDLDDDGIPMPRDLPYPEAGLPGADCDECGGMGHTIGFEGPKRIKHPCETCGGDK